MNRAADGATGAGKFRMLFNLDDFGSHRLETLSVYAVNGILLAAVEALPGSLRVVPSTIL